jgi:hypothetical protein
VPSLTRLHYDHVEKATLLPMQTDEERKHTTSGNTLGDDDGLPTLPGFRLRASPCERG